MEKNTRSKGSLIGIIGFLLAFYLIIVLYIFFVMLDLDRGANFWIGLSFEGIGYFLLAFLLFGRIASGRMRIGFFAPLVIVSIIYTLLLNTVNFIGIALFSRAVLVLAHLFLLFIYCLIALPMAYIGGK